MRRQDPTRRGKGYAIEFGLSELAKDPPEIVIIVDADCRVEPGSIAILAERAKTMAMVLESTQHPERDIPDYLSLDVKHMKATFVRTPKMADVPFPVQMEPNLVIEYYSR